MLKTWLPNVLGEDRNEFAHALIGRIYAWDLAAANVKVFEASGSGEQTDKTKNVDMAEAAAGAVGSNPLTPPIVLDLKRRLTQTSFEVTMVDSPFNDVAMADVTMAASSSHDVTMTLHPPHPAQV